MLARRSFVKSFAGLPLAAVLANPTLARAAADSLQSVTIETGRGRTVSASLALPARTPAPALILVHEWWGLNDQIKAVAAEFAQQGYVALAIDLYKGEVATTPGGARSLMGRVSVEEGIDTSTSWAAWLQQHDAGNGKLGTVGWCFGGGWSLTTSLKHPVDATVVYYGRVAGLPEELSALKGPVMGHYATRDNWINKEMVGSFEEAMKEAGQPFVSHWYEADHAFANPSGGRYDEADAKLAWERTLAFYAEHLKS